MAPPNPDPADRFPSDMLSWAEDNLRTFPWRTSSTSPFEVLVAEILLKQTRATTVADILPRFLREYPDPASLSKANREELIEFIRPLGLYNYRSRALREIGATLAENGVPCQEEELLELPQVGKYVANATLCFGFGRSRPVVDSNVKRVYGRLFKGLNPDAETDEKLWSFAEDLLPKDGAERYNMALLDFGAEICTSSSPKCEECFATAYCDYYRQDVQVP